MAMSQRLRILHLEDEPDYSRFVQDLLVKGGVAADVTLVASEADFNEAIAQEEFDLVLADYSLPDWTGIQALNLVKEKVPQTPFLLVSGTIGEQFAIESLKAGATDYVLKQWPDRLVPAVRRAIDRERDWDRAHVVPIGIRLDSGGPVRISFLPRPLPCAKSI